MGMRFSYAVMQGGRAWLVPRDFSAIAEIDLNTSKSKFITRFDGYRLLDGLQCGAIQKNDNYIAVAPFLGDDFFLFNLKESRLVKLSAREIIKNKNFRVNQIKFFASFYDNTNIFFVGWQYPGIIKIDTESNRMKVVDISEAIDKQTETDYIGTMGRTVGICGRKVFIPLCNKKEFVVFDLDKEQYEIQKIGDYCCVATCCDGHNLCLLPMWYEDIEIYNIKEKRLKRKVKLPYNMKGMTGEQWYRTVCYHCGYAWIFPSKSNMILRLNMQTGEAICVKEFDDIADIKYLNAGIYDKSSIWGFYQKENRLDIINCYSLQVESKHFFEPSNIKDFFSREERLAFNKCQLENFISGIGQQESISADYENSIYIGKNIWKKIKEII